MFISKKILHQTLACSSVLFIQYLIGQAYGWVPITLKKLQCEESIFKISEEEASWMVSVNELGKISGPVVAPFIIDSVGRRHSMLLAMYSMSILWPSIFFAQNIYSICIIRFIFGCVHGFFDVLSCIYITEICSPTIRVTIGSILTVVFTAGIFSETILATYLSYNQIVLVNAAIAICGICTIYFCVETPHFLMLNEKYEEAGKTIVWLSGLQTTSSGDCFEKIESIKTTAQEENCRTKSLKKLLSSSANSKSICIVMGMHVISMLTGSSVIAPYCSMIFSSSETISANHYVIMYGACIFISASLSPFIISKLDKRRLLIVSFCIIGLSHICSTVLLYYHNRDYQLPNYPWLIFACIGVYGIVRQMFGPALYVLRAELLPLSVRAIGGSITVITSAITGFFVAKTFLPITAYVGMETNFFLYACMSFLMAFVIYHFLPKTADKSSEEIQAKLESGNATEVSIGETENKDSKLHTLFR